MYGVDLESGVMRDRTWRWFSVRVSALTQDPATRTFRSAASFPPAPSLPAI